jgi:hypothetical protein
MPIKPKLKIKPRSKVAPKPAPGLTPGKRELTDAEYAAWREAGPTTEQLWGLRTPAPKVAPKVAPKPVQQAAAEPPKTWYGNLGSQAVESAKTSAPFSIASNLLGRMTSPQPEVESAPPTSPAYPGMYAYASSLTPERALAFEAGLDWFCKDAGFDEEDRQAMHALIKQAVNPAWVVRGVGAVNRFLRPMVGKGAAKWISRAPVAAAKAAPGLTAQMGGMMAADYAINKAMGGEEEQPQAPQVPAAYAGPASSGAPGSPPINIRSPLYRYAAANRSHDEQLAFEHGVALFCKQSGLSSDQTGQIKQAIPLAPVAGMAGKAVGKALPGVGAALSGADAIRHFSAGNWGRGLLDVGAGLASFIPGVGTAASLGLSGLSGAMDVADGTPTAQPNQPRRMPGVSMPKMKLAALDVLRRTSPAQLKQAFWGEGVLQGLASGGSKILSNAPLVGRAFSGLQPGVDAWGGAIKTQRKEERDEARYGPTKDYEAGYWDRFKSQFNMGPDEEEIGAYNQKAMMNRQKKLSLTSNDPKVKAEAKRQYGMMEDKGHEKIMEQADFAAADQGAFSSDPARQRTARRRAASSMGSMRNEARNRWDNVANKGGAGEGVGHRSWQGGENPITPASPIGNPPTPANPPATPGAPIPPAFKPPVPGT